MNDAASKDGEGHGSGLYESLKTLLSTLLAILHTRGQILATELEEERLRLELRVLLSLTSLFFLGLGLFFLTLWIVMAAGTDHRLAALFGAALFYLLLAAAMLLRLRQVVRSKPRLFEISLSEIAKDRHDLGPPS